MNKISMFKTSSGLRPICQLKKEGSFYTQGFKESRPVSRAVCQPNKTEKEEENAGNIQSTIQAKRSFHPGKGSAGLCGDGRLC
jgi:hypothetical protein